VAYTVKFEHPHFPTGEDAPEFGVTGLGRVVNGGSLEVDEDMERNFVTTSGKSVEDAFKNDSLVTLSGSSELSADDLKSLLPAPEPTEPVQGFSEEKPAWLAPNDGSSEE
jgi:hypothetical protein